MLLPLLVVGAGEGGGLLEFSATAAALGAGIGFLVALWLAYRRQRLAAERALAETRIAEERTRAALAESAAQAAETEQILRALFDHAAIGMVRLAPDGSFLDANPAFARMLGHASSAELLAAGPDAARQAYPDDAGRAVFLAHAAAAITPGRGGEPASAAADAREAELRRRDGTTVWVQGHLRAVRDADGEPRYFIGTVQDLSVRRLLEQQVRQAQKMESIGRLTGGVAHDFNNLLTAIFGYAQLLQRRLGAGSTAGPLVEQILRAGERAEGLTRQLLNFCRQEPLERQTFDLSLVAKETGYLLRRLISEDIHLSLQLAPAPVMVTADPGELGQVVMNLALNARDAMPHGGELHVSTGMTRLPSEDGNASPSPDLPPGFYALLTVRDEGHGMDAATQERVFKPFFTTKERGRGTGLGLSTVCDIVRNSNGDVTVESTPGLGATFRVFIPLAERAAPAPETAPPALPELPAGARESVLVVEDEEILRTLMVELLEAQGYEVHCASDGEEALAVAADCGPGLQLLVTDVVMPRLNGHALAGQLTARRPGLRVLYISGHGEHVALDGGAAAGGPAEFMLLPKPFRGEELTRAVREALDRAGVEAGR